MLKLKLQYFGHLMQRADSLEKTLMLGGTGGRRRRGWEGWTASLTRWMWVQVNSRSWWWTERPGVLQFMGSQRVGHDWVTELNWCSFYACFWRVFIINGYWILSNDFLASTDIIIWFLSFNLLTQYITLIDLQILKNPCIPGIKPTWSRCMIFLMCCWTLLEFFWGFLHLCSSVILACSFLFCVASLSGFDIRGHH